MHAIETCRTSVRGGVARQQLLERRPVEEPAPDDVSTDDASTDDEREGWEDEVVRLTGVDLRVCPACGNKRMVVCEIVPPIKAALCAARAPPPTTDTA